MSMSRRNSESLSECKRPTENWQTRDPFPSGRVKRRSADPANERMWGSKQSERLANSGFDEMSRRDESTVKRKKNRPQERQETDRRQRTSERGRKEEEKDRSDSGQLRRGLAPFGQRCETFSIRVYFWPQSSSPLVSFIYGGVTTLQIHLSIFGLLRFVDSISYGRGIS